MVRQIGSLSRQLLCVVALVVAAGCSDGGDSIPSLSGTPATQAQVGQAYSFTPTVSDPGRAAIGFSVKNKPSWTSFNVATGQISGTPSSSNIGTYPDILITASTHTASASLRSFTIAVASGSTTSGSTTSASTTSGSTTSGSTTSGSTAGGNTAGGSADPLNLPLVTSSTPLLTFLGSFKAPTSFVYGGGALSTSGTTMYMTGLYYYGSGCGGPCYVPGMGSFTIPTLSGAPALDGSNGTATAIVAPTTQVDGSGNPILNFGQAASVTHASLTGSLVYGGELYITAGPFYDSERGANAFIVQADTNIANSSFGVPNTASTANNTYQRFFAGPLGVVPSIWQPYFGGPCYVTSGNNAGGSGLSSDTSSPAGFMFSTFNCAAYNSAGGAISVTENLDYYWTDVTSTYDPNPEMLSYRSFSGPFPLTGTGASYSLTAAPKAGATSATLTTGFTNGYNNPAGEFYVTFSDGEQRLVHLTIGNTSVPDGLWTCNYGVTGCASFAALTCSPSCTTAVTIAPGSDNYLVPYDGGFGYGFFVPGSRSFLFINIHEYGPDNARFLGCNTNASGGNDNPISPDTLYYRRLQITAYDARDLYAAHQGTQAVYVASPYAWWEFPNWQANWGAGTNCIASNGPGNFYFDPDTDILYGVFSSNQDTDGHMIVNEWLVSGT